MTYTFEFRGSIVVSISACHAEDPGSIPGRGVFRFWRAATPALDAHTCLRAARWRRVRPGFFAVPVWQWRGSLGSTCLLSNSVLESVPPSNRILLFAPPTEGGISRGAREACRAAHLRRSNGCGTSAGVLPWSPLWTAGAAGLLRLARVAVARVGLTAHYVPPFPWALGSTCLLSNSVLECVPPSNR